MLDLRKVFKRNFRGNVKYLLSFLPDKLYIQVFFFACNGKFINFKHPKTFCDKMNWLKIYDRHPEYSKLADKLAVREHIKEVLGEEYLFPIYGSWRSFDEIDFDSLPEQFVLKCNHDSGSVKVIKSKKDLTEKDYADLKKFYDKRLSRDFFYSGREYSYKGIDRFVFAEKYMTSKDDNLEAFHDYKFLSFNGKPELMYIETERDIGVKMDAFDMQFNPVNIIGDKPSSGHLFEKPAAFDEMRRIAAELSQGIKFVRIDFRVLDGRVYFGEYTFYDNGGFREYRPKEWDAKLASMIEI